MSYIKSDNFFEFLADPFLMSLPACIPCYGTEVSEAIRGEELEQLPPARKELLLPE